MSERIPNAVRIECLRLLKAGNGYKRTARIAGVNVYTVIAGIAVVAIATVFVVRKIRK